MKKRCTNNKCRKNFVVRAETDSCPYCGKMYPRLSKDAILRNKDIIENLKNSLELETIFESLRNGIMSSSSMRTPKGVDIMYINDNNMGNLISVVKKWTGRGIKESAKLVRRGHLFIDANEIESPFESFITELDEIGCLYRITY